MSLNLTSSNLPALPLTKLPAFGFQTKNCHAYEDEDDEDLKNTIFRANRGKVLSYLPIISALAGIVALVEARQKDSHVSKNYRIRGVMNILHLTPLLLLIDVVVTIARQIKIIINQNHRLLCPPVSDGKGSINIDRREPIIESGIVALDESYSDSDF